MARFRKRRKRFRRKRKMSFNRRVKRVIKRDKKKTVEMKVSNSNLSRVEMATAGQVFEFHDYVTIGLGTGTGNRIGDQINLHLWKINMNLQGHDGVLTSVPLRYRILVAYSSGSENLLVGDFPSSVFGFMNLEEQKQKGIYIIKDFTGVLAPCCDTPVSAADKYTRWAAAHATSRMIRLNVRLKGRQRAYDNTDGVISKGRLWLYAISEVDAADHSFWEADTRLFYTDQ